MESEINVDSLLIDCDYWINSEIKTDPASYDKFQCVYLVFVSDFTADSTDSIWLRLQNSDDAENSIWNLL